MRHEETVLGEHFKVTTMRDDGGGKAPASTRVTFEAFGQVFIVEKRRGGLLTREEIPAPLTIGEIAAEISKRYDVSVTMIRSGNMHRTVKEARWMLIYLARKKTIASFPEIGIYLGQNHSTVVAAFRNMERRMSKRRSVVTTTTTANDDQECAPMITSAPSDVRAS